MRSHASHYALAGLAACVVALSGCGTTPAPGSGTSSPSGATTPASTGGATTPAKVVLKFTVSNGPAVAPSRWTLRCDPPGGTRPDPAATCAALMRTQLITKPAFAMPSKHVMCPMIMVTSRRIVVVGTWFGTKVHRVIIDGGCDVGLFEAMGKLLR